MSKKVKEEQVGEEGTDEKDTVRYFIKCRDEEFVIELPRNWKVTFANVNPASNHPGSGHCVRAYEMPGNHLRAVYANAISIRDLSIPYARRVKSEVGSSSWSQDSSGNFSGTTDIKTDIEYLTESSGNPFK